MKLAVATVLAAAAGLLGASTALAQPGSYAPPPGPAPAPQPAATAPELPKWGVGLRLMSMEITSNDDEDHVTELGGIGIHVQYRLAPNWRAELAIENGRTNEEADLGFERNSDMGTLALHYVFNPFSRWNWYALGGIGQTQTEILYGPNGEQGVEEFTEGHLHLGLGLERRFERISLGAELRAVALHRDDSEGDGEFYAGVDGPVPAESSAGQLNLHFTYFF